MSNTVKKFPKIVIYLTWVSQNIAWLCAKLFFSIFFKIEVKGLENVQEVKRGILFASNHVSDFDSVLIRAAIPLSMNTFPFFAVSRSSHDYQWRGWRRLVYRDWVFRFLGAYPAPKGMRDYEKALNTFVRLGRSKQSIIIFIGGKQQTIDEPIKNKGGAAYLVWSTGLPVVPVAIVGTHGLCAKKIFLERPRVTISYGTPLHKSDLFVNQKDEHVQPSEYASASGIICNEITKMITTTH